MVSKPQQSLEAKLRSAVQTSGSGGSSYVQREAGEAIYVAGEAADSLVLLVQGQVRSPALRHSHQNSFAILNLNSALMISEPSLSDPSHKNEIYPSIQLGSPCIGSGHVWSVQGCNYIREYVARAAQAGPRPQHRRDASRDCPPRQERGGVGEEDEASSWVQESLRGTCCGRSTGSRLFFGCQRTQARE